MCTCSYKVAHANLTIICYSNCQISLGNPVLHCYTIVKRNRAMFFIRYSSLVHKNCNVTLSLIVYLLMKVWSFLTQKQINYISSTFFFATKEKNVYLKTFSIKAELYLPSTQIHLQFLEVTKLSTIVEHFHNLTKIFSNKNAIKCEY